MPQPFEGTDERLALRAGVDAGTTQADWYAIPPERQSLAAY